MHAHEHFKYFSTNAQPLLLGKQEEQCRCRDCKSQESRTRTHTPHTHARTHAHTSQTPAFSLSQIPPMGHFSELSVTGCPGLQFSGPDVQLGGRISARVRALRLRSRKAARISGAVVAGAAALPFMVVLGIAVGAYYGVRRLRRSTR
eukprot:m.112843 g.112843  ORF g.112843 m.112843 type:complete len:147 (-) comp15987_c2_seq5:1033-1473(-)